MKKILFAAFFLVPGVLNAGPDPKGVLELEGYGNSDAVGITAKRGRNDFTIKEPLASGDLLYFVKGYGYNGTAFGTNPAASIEMSASQAWTSTANGSKIVFKTTPNGSATQATALTINNDASVSFSSAVTVNASTTAVNAFIISATATNDDPTVVTQLVRGTTTDGNANTIWSITLDANTSYLFEANVLGYRTGGSSGAAGDSGAYKVFGGVVDVSGTATAVGAGTSTAITLEDQAGWNAAFALSGNTVLLQVTGAANNNVVWHAEIKFMKVAS